MRIRKEKYKHSTKNTTPAPPNSESIVCQVWHSWASGGFIYLSSVESVPQTATKVIIEKFRGEVSLMEQDTIENVS